MIVKELQNQIQDIVEEMDEIKERFQDQITSMNAVEDSFAHFQDSSRESLEIVEQVGNLIATADSVNLVVVASMDDIYEIS